MKINQLWDRNAYQRVPMGTGDGTPLIGFRRLLRLGYGEGRKTCKALRYAGLSVSGAIHFSATPGD